MLGWFGAHVYKNWILIHTLKLIKKLQNGSLTLNVTAKTSRRNKQKYL